MITLDPERIPQHIAIIMDGNGRWAKARGLDRSLGHQEGAATVRDITEEASNLGVKFLTLYTFSTENWSRPEREVATLMALIIDSLEEELFMANNVRLRVIGDRTLLPDFVCRALDRCEQNTAVNSGMTMVLALSYSARWEMTAAVRKLARQVADGQLSPEDIDEQAVERSLETYFMPDPELLIRTGGELRLSNFLLWQSAYSELYFTDVFWPDFSAEELHRAIADYQHRERRFGKTSEQVTQA